MHLQGFRNFKKRKYEGKAIHKEIKIENIQEWKIHMNSQIEETHQFLRQKSCRRAKKTKRA